MKKKNEKHLLRRPTEPIWAILGALTEVTCYVLERLADKLEALGKWVGPYLKDYWDVALGTALILALMYITASLIVWVCANVFGIVGML